MEKRRNCFVFDGRKSGSLYEKKENCIPTYYYLIRVDSNIPGMVAQAFNPSIWEVEASKSL